MRLCFYYAVFVVGGEPFQGYMHDFTIYYESLTNRSVHCFKHHFLMISALSCYLHHGLFDYDSTTTRRQLDFDLTTI